MAWEPAEVRTSAKQRGQGWALQPDRLGLNPGPPPPHGDLRPLSLLCEAGTVRAPCDLQSGVRSGRELPGCQPRDRAPRGLGGEACVAFYGEPRRANVGFRTARS